MKNSKGKLVLTKYNEFYGIIGTETNTIVNGVTVCIGDIVKVKKDKHYNECEGIVAVFENKIAIMGLASRQIDTLEVTEIVQSHKELKLNSNPHNGYFNVVKFE